jgi:hypothetical protein
MLKLIAFILLCLIFVGAFLFFVNGPQEVRDRFWDNLELDVLYVQDGRVISGWIWEERDDVIIGEMVDKTIFSVGTQECERVVRDAFIGYLEQLI